MNNAAACGHPIDLTRLDRLMRAQTVAVDKLTFQQISHCRQSDMRMRRNIDSSARSKGHGSHVIEKDEWPFIFLDHMGPVTLAPGRGVDVPPHPHIGLATVTYLLEGELIHRDSLGSHQTIQPGEINWMTAGRGFVHSERTSSRLRAAGSSLHALQMWVA